MFYQQIHALDYPRNVPDLLVFDRNSSPLDESRALVPKGDRPLLRRGARTNFKRNSSLTAPQRNRRSESDSIDSLRRLDENNNNNSNSIVRSSSAEGITLADSLGETTATRGGGGGGAVLTEEPSPMLSPVAENEEVRDLCIATREEQSLTSPSPPAPVVMARSVSTSTTTSNQSRKSAWSWAFWSDEKSSKKNNKIEPNTASNTVNTTTTTEDDKPADTTATGAATTANSSSSSSNNNKRFTLSSLFSRKSKSNNNQSNASYTTNFDLFLDEQKKAPKDFQLNRMHMTRLPLHVERAIYKLSHVKLANPRRPLHEQVLISNQMFWYLSVIAANGPQPATSASSAYDMSSEEQPQKKAPRKRLVKKQKPRPVSAPQQQPYQPHHQHRQQVPSSKKRTNSHTANSNQKGNTPMFMANPRTATNESTGFVVPENYLNPKQQQQQQQQPQLQSKKKPTVLGNNTSKKAPLYHKQQQGSDSSSSDDDDDDDDDNDDNSDDDHGREAITEKIVISPSEKEDELPLVMYKSNAYHKKIK